MLIRRDKATQPRRPWAWPAEKPKPRLRAKHLPHYRVHYTDLEDYLQQVYRMRGFEFFKATGFRAGLVPEFIIDGQLPPSWAADNKVARIRQGNPSGDLPLIMNLLCHDGFIPPGTYQIDTHPIARPIDTYRELLTKHRSNLHPECLQFREKHDGDTTFTKQAALLDHAVTKWLHDQQ